MTNNKCLISWYERSYICLWNPYCHMKQFLRLSETETNFFIKLAAKSKRNHGNHFPNVSVQQLCQALSLVLWRHQLL